MTSNQIGPDKGLLDMVFGKKETAAQATDAVTKAADGKDASVKQGPEDFIAMLAKAAQDQKDAAAALATAQIKGETKQVTKSAAAAEAAKKEAAAALAKQKGKAGETGAQLKNGAKEAAEEEQKARAKALGMQIPTAAQTSAMLQAQAQAKAKSEAEQAALQGAAGPKALPAPTAAQAAKSATSATGGVPGVGGGLSGQAAVTAAQQAAVAAQQAAVTAQQAAQLVMQQGMAQSQTVVQPIVIQVPMAIPVEVLGVEEGELDHFDMGGAPMGSMEKGSKAQLTSSQDFLAQLGIRQGSVLGVDRVDPRLGRFNDESQNEKSKDGSLSMMMPQLTHQHGQFGATALATPVAGTVQMTVGENGKPELANTMALANEVATLAARGGGAVRVRISPENLGEMTISVKTEGQRLNVQIETASSAARDAMTNAMPELRQLLTASHYQVGSLEVNHAASTAQVVMSQAGDAVGMSQWSNQSSFSDWQGGQQDNQQGGSAWDRYRTQQEARQEAKQQQQYRQSSGYRRYQQEQLEA